jgi:hypothetical protein
MTVRYTPCFSVVLNPARNEILWKTYAFDMARALPFPDLALLHFGVSSTI